MRAATSHTEPRFAPEELSLVRAGSGEKNAMQIPCTAAAMYTAAEIGSAAGWSKRQVLSALSLIPRSGTKLASGNPADAWSLSALPAPLALALDERARSGGYLNTASLLADPVEEWSAGPISKISPEDMTYARKLQAVLTPLLIAQSNPRSDLSQVKQTTIREYCRAFAVPMVTPRHLDRLVDMVINRDRGFDNWHRVELFLPMKFRPAQDKPASPISAGDFPMAAICDALSAVSNSENPSPDDRSMVWRASVQTFMELVEAGHKEKRVKKEIRQYLLRNATWIGTTDESLKKGLNAKIRIAQDKGVGGIQDLRKTNSGTWRENDFEDDKQLLLKAAYLHQDISLAHRRLVNGFKNPKEEKFMQFSEAYRKYLNFDPRRRKSYVPKFMRNYVTPILAAGPADPHGPRAEKSARPCRLRDASDIQPNDWHTSDDETANSFVYWIDPKGPYECEELGRFNVGRPQILPLYDVKSEMPLALSVSPTPGYSSDTIRDLIVKAWLDDGIGMPFQGCYFERGIWKSRHVKALTEWSQIDGAFAERNLSLRIRHATTPRAKIIERIFAVEQARTATFPGYVGRGNKGDRFELVDRFLQSLKKVGQPHKAAVDPREMLWPIEKFEAELRDVMVEISKEFKRGSVFRGRSPEEVWNESVKNGRPHEVLPPNLRYLLATQQDSMKVTLDGVKISRGNDTYQFLGKRLGMLVGERVNVRWSGRVPEYIIVTHPKSDPKGLNPFIVSERKRLLSMNSTREDFARARQEEDDFLSGPKAIISLIRPARNLTIQRADHGTEELRHAGSAHRQIVEHHLQERDDQRKVAPRVREMSRNLGLDTSGKDPRIVERQLQELTDLLREPEEEQPAISRH